MKHRNFNKKKQNDFQKYFTEERKEMVRRGPKTRKRHYNITMTKDSPQMETYSRLLSHLQESCKQKKPEIYEEFITDIPILISNNSDVLRLVESDLKYILPSVLLYSVYKDVRVRNAAIKSFDTFTNIVNKKPSIKNEPWYKDMECTLIAQEFSSHLIKLVEATDDTWPHIWSFVISLIVHDEQVHGVAINSLLKVVEIAFKLSRKFETVLEKAYYCWNRLIDIFSVHPRIVTSQKLIELLVRPLSTNLSLKCPKLKLETWSNLVHKVGFACTNTKCKLVIEPFIDFAYLKANDSLCHLFPLDCITAFRDIIKEKKLYRFCVTKIMSALLQVFESGRSEDLNQYIIEIWTGLIDNTKEIEKANVNDYITELINKIPQILQIDRPGLNEAIIKVTLEKKVFSSENMKIFIVAQVPIMPIISSFMGHCDFQKDFFVPIIDNLVEYFLEVQNKKSQSSVELEIWDLVCEIFILWLKSLPLPQEPSAIDIELLSSLLLVPLLSKQWSVPVQKTWNSVLEYTQIIVPSNNYLLQFIDKFYKELSGSHVSPEFAVEFCTFLSNKDKSVFKSLMPTFNFISKSLQSKDPKPLMELLVLIENSIKFIPKQDLMKLLTELMSSSNSYGQPYDLRIKTKITKLQRKLFTLKDPNESSKEQDGQQSKSQEKEQQNGQKTRSPLMAHSNFLHRLAKAEEKKVKKRASMSSLFGDIHQHDEVEASSPEKGDEQKVTAKSPLVQTPTDGKDSKADVNKAEVKEAEDKKLPLNQTPVNGKDKMNDSNEEEEVKIKEIEEKKLPLNQTSVSGKDKKNDLNKEEVKIKEVEEKKLPLNGKSSPAIPSVVTVVTTPNRKRGVKQPELLLSQESKKSVTKAIPTPPPPSYFEEEAMDYVIVPPKPKSTPLTEHQKEMLSKRRSDIPALYQDLSQDTQSMNSQSIKEIIMLKEIKLNDTTKSSEVITTKDDETSNTPARTDEENNKKEQAEKMLIENGTSDKIVEDSQEIINDTQPNHDSGVNLSLTPTKHTSTLPTQKNLLNKFNLLECDENGESKKVDEEDEVEKENKIVNIEEVQKVTPIKRRSSRKSTNKYLTKKSEETPKNKTKKDISESTATAELISKGKSKKSLETAGKNSDNTSFLKVKNSDPQDGLKELEVNGIKESEKKFTESISCVVVKEETKSLINPFPTDTKEKPIEKIENTS
ncbi:centromere-associated protein E, partial [Halyomorpha halys]|uniref:centromere-associated protein E n=1 Tax=Halyomorpha halys TaxID=286706 RepID=UPI0006D4DB2E